MMYAYPSVSTASCNESGSATTGSSAVSSVVSSGASSSATGSLVSTGASTGVSAGTSGSSVTGGNTGNASSGRGSGGGSIFTPGSVVCSSPVQVSSTGRSSSDCVSSGSTGSSTCSLTPSVFSPSVCSPTASPAALSARENRGIDRLDISIATASRRARSWIGFRFLIGTSLFIGDEFPVQPPLPPVAHRQGDNHGRK